MPGKIKSLSVYASNLQTERFLDSLGVEFRLFDLRVRERPGEVRIPVGPLRLESCSVLSNNPKKYPTAQARQFRQANVPKRSRIALFAFDEIKRECLLTMHA